MTTAWIAADWPAPGGIVAGTLLRDQDIESLDVPGEPCWLEQVHGASAVIAGAYDAPPRADGSVSRSAEHVCVVRTADCLPVLLCADDGRVVAAAHAGWRGLAAGVIEATIALMDTAPRRLLAWLGPAISQPAFEVGEEVRDAFAALEPDDTRFFAANARGRWQADLYGLARRRLASLGVTRVSGGDFCTFGDPARFYSYRRQPECGRMVSFVAIGDLEKRGPDAISGPV